MLPGAPHLDHNRIHIHHTHTSHTRIPHRGCTDRTHIQVPQTAPLLDTMYDLATHRALSANTEKHPLRKLIQQNWLRIQHEASPTVYSRIQRVSTSNLKPLTQNNRPQKSTQQLFVLHQKSVGTKRTFLEKTASKELNTKSSNKTKTQLLDQSKREFGKHKGPNH